MVAWLVNSQTAWNNPELRVYANVPHESEMLYLSVVTKVWVNLSYEPVLSLWVLSIHLPTGHNDLLASENVTS